MLVVDASVACKWYLLEVDSAAACGLLESDHRLIAPELIVAEVCNAVWRRLNSGRIGAEQARQTALEVIRAFDQLLPIGVFAARVLTIAEILRHPVYDCFYLALAEEVAAPLVTADRRLVQRVAGTEWSARVTPLDQFRAQ